jgi:Na+-driven multidrug efflux pump
MLGNQYFKILAYGNFLFPLNITLTSFYLARGKTVWVSCWLLVSYGLNVLLCWVLISAYGIRGAALAKCLSLGLSCLIFGIAFLHKKNRELYGTGAWQLQPHLLGAYLRPGLVRAFGYFWFRGGWVAISYLMIKKGGLYLGVQTIGGTIITFLIFIVTGLYRSVLTIAPNLLGSQSYSELERLFRSLILYVGMIGAVLAIPLLLYPQSLICFFNGTTRTLFTTIFPLINHWVWLYLILLTLQMGFCGLLVAARDLKTQFYAYLLTTLTSLLPIYLMMGLGHADPDQLWLIMALEEVVLIPIFWYRWSRKKWVWAQNKPI